MSWVCEPMQAETTGMGGCGHGFQFCIPWPPHTHGTGMVGSHQYVLRMWRLFFEVQILSHTSLSITTHGIQPHPLQSPPYAFLPFHLEPPHSWEDAALHWQHCIKCQECVGETEVQLHTKARWGADAWCGSCVMCICLEKQRGGTGA